MKNKLSTGFLIITFLLLNGIKLLAQSEIHGSITDDGSNPIKDASVLLLKSSDSSLVKGVISDASGKYSFENINKGKYLVSASFTGMQQVFTKIFEITSDKTEINSGIIILKNANVQLQ